MRPPVAAAVSVGGFGAARRDARVWGASGLVALVVLAAGGAGTPLELRFELSKEAMDDTALAVLDGRRDPATINRIGVWNVRNVRRVRGGMRFEVVGAGFLDRVGFAYQADGLPPPGNYVFKYYRGGWYIWRSQVEL